MHICVYADESRVVGYWDGVGWILCNTASDIKRVPVANVLIEQKPTKIDDLSLAWRLCRLHLHTLHCGQRSACTKDLPVPEICLSVPENGIARLSHDQWTFSRRAICCPYMRLRIAKTLWRGAHLLSPNNLCKGGKLPKTHYHCIIVAVRPSSVCPESSLDR